MGNCIETYETRCNWCHGKGTYDIFYATMEAEDVPCTSCGQTGKVKHWKLKKRDNKNQLKHIT